MWFRTAIQVLLAVALVVLMVGPSLAGPWPRTKGEVFLSLSAEGDRDGNSYLGLYGEYGLAPRHTLGFELGHSNAGESSAMIWWQRVLDGGEGPDRLTVSTGIGVLQRDGKALPLVQAGAAWGRGLDSVPLLKRIPGGGWLAVDARVKLAAKPGDDTAIDPQAMPDALTYLTPDITAKAEVTLGLKPTQSLMLINQLRLEHRDDLGFSARLATSLVYDFGGPAKVELGVVAPISGSGQAALRIGTWLQF